VRRSNAVPLGRAYLTIAALAATSGLTAACGSDDEEGNVYCADEDGVVVDETYCDDDDGTAGRYFLWVGTRFAYNDSAARSKYGLPSTGQVTNGTAVAGGFGSGRSGSGGG